MQGGNPEILFEDNHVLVVVKPPGMPVQADISGAADLLNYLKEYLKRKYDKPGNVFLGLVHRLDRNVGGVMVFARTSKAASRLSAQVRAHTWEKIYLAEVAGTPVPAAGRLRHYLTKDGLNNTVSVSNAPASEGKLAELEYTVVESKGETSVLRIKLLTGRSHQIRAQLAFIGHPLVGDYKYGSKQGHPHQLHLWAEQLTFHHPISNEELSFSSPATWLKA